MTRHQKTLLIGSLEAKLISIYHLKEAAVDVKKADVRVNVLYVLLIEEINRQNGLIQKKINGIRKQATTD